MDGPLLKCFDVQSDQLDCPLGHMCCDLCAHSCKCTDKECSLNLHLSIVTPKQSQTRTVSKNQVLELENTITNKGISSKKQHVSIIGCPSKLLEFGADQVQQAVNSSKKIFTISDVSKYVDIRQTRNAASILEIFKSIFQDIDQQIMDINYDDEEEDVEAYTYEWEKMENDQSFMEFLDQSEWFVHSLVED